MANSDTTAAKKYASIAEVAAAQAQIVLQEAIKAPEYAEQAQEYAEQAQSSADTSSQLLTQVQSYTSIASSAQESASQSSISAQSSATDAASSAEAAGAAAQEKVDILSANLGSGELGSGDNLIKHALDSSLGDSLTLYTYIDQYISLEAFHLSAVDGSDYGPAITRASAYAAENGVAIRVDKKFLISSQPTLSSDTTLSGLGRHTGLYCADDTPVVMVYANGKSNITIENMSINGGVTSSTSSSDTTRGVRFISCDSVIVNNVFAERIADWGFSFETCTNVRVTKHTHTGGGYATPGGRDGLHFLNCINVNVDDCDIESGDDCIGVTVEDSFQSYNISISSIRGVSDIASVVTVGFESDQTGTIYNLKIDNIYAKTSGGARYIVQCRGTSTGAIADVSISRVYGTSTLYGLYLQNIARVVLSDINVTSNTQHGMYANNCNNIIGNHIRAIATTSGYDGMQFASCSGRVILDNPASSAGPTYCAQFNACGEVVVRDANFTEGGTASFRAVNNTRVVFSGNATNTTGPYGISSAGNSYIKVEPGSQVSGVTAAYTQLPYGGISDEAYAFGDITQSDSTTISSSSVYTSNLTLAATATGTITVTFDRAMRTNRYGVKVQPYGSTYAYAQVLSKTTTGFTLYFYNASAELINTSFWLEVNNSGSTYV